jgi:alpha-galactosidase
MPKITFIGAGSTVFAKDLLGAILAYPELRDSTIALFDIDEERLKTSERVARKIARQVGGDPIIEATTDRKRALDGSDYVLSMFQVAGYRPGTVTDFAIPKRFGLRQTIGDTLGIGGIMRGLRTIPVLLELCREMEKLCPEVTFLNYVNPMAMNCWAVSRASSIRTIGLCHSVPHTAAAIAQDIGVPVEEIDYLVAGINHVAFFLRLERRGEDLYPRLRRVLEEGRVPADNRVRYALLKDFEYFVTESSEHFSEYVPWFIKRDRPDLIERYGIPLDEYLRRSEALIARWGALRDELESTDRPVATEPTVDFGPRIIHSIETGTPRTVYGNVMNHGLIDNLPRESCVEVPCLVDGNGVQPTRIGAIPPQLAALMQTNVNVQWLTVEAALTGDRRRVYQAAMLDPHTAAELDPEQITELVDELIAAHGEWLPQFSGGTRERVGA